mgnify:CR=1 FL=1
MHTMNVRAIVFKGEEGKKAIRQILNAKPVKNKYTTTIAERSKLYVSPVITLNIFLMM